MLACNPLSSHHEGITELLIGAPNRDKTLRVAIYLLSEGRDPSTGYAGDLLQAMAAVSNHMPHKIFGDDQRGREAVGGELPRVMSQEGSCDRFAGGC